MAKEKILIVDDEKLILTSLAADLADHDFVVITEETGKAGLQQLTAGNIDLMITDLSLGEMNGIEVLENAKKIQSELPVIILTGYGTVETAIDALRLGADDYLLKPCNLEELLFRINSVLEKKELNRKAESGVSRIGSDSP